MTFLESPTPQVHEMTFGTYIPTYIPHTKIPLMYTIERRPPACFNPQGIREIIARLASAKRPEEGRWPWPRSRFTSS